MTIKEQNTRIAVANCQKGAEVYLPEEGRWRGSRILLKK